jgi:phenylacetate-CoA ligase
MTDFPHGYVHFKGQVGQSQWPRIPGPWAAGVAAALYQIDQAQWWPDERRRQLQWQQAALLLAHAYSSSPLYRDLYLEAGILPEQVHGWDDWQRLPIVSRNQLQRAGDQWHSQRIPKDHGELMQHFSSGSTGTPLAAYGTSLSYLIKMALVVRNHQWAGRRLGERAAFILDQGDEGSEQGVRSEYWQRSLADTVESGPSLAISVKLSIEKQCALLQQFRPAYLFTYPSVVAALAQHAMAHGLDMGFLEQIGTLGEILSPACRAIAHRAWGVPVVDGYSAREVGPIALQCPDGEHYHVQSDAVLVEVLRDDGGACAPGETGRVVLTSLHNFASPMIRYEIGDYAEVGPPCRCGRRLPVLKRILGRRRNLLTYPDGQRRWPSLGSIGFAQLQMLGLPAIRQFQIVQHDLDRLEVRIIADRSLSASEQAHAGDYLRRELGQHWQLEFSYPELLAGRRGKFEDFVSLLEDPVRTAEPVTP